MAQKTSVLAFGKIALGGKDLTSGGGAIGVSALRDTLERVGRRASIAPLSLEADPDGQRPQPS